MSIGCNDEPGMCLSLTDLFARIGDKWTLKVVDALVHRPIRYNEIHQAVAGISQRMLTRTLKGLEQDGLINRTMYLTIPPRVEYELTELGQQLIVALQSLYDWALVHQQAMSAARANVARTAQDEKLPPGHD
ncbi:helix-turn-helix domain-containing protein [Pseudomonas cucumis]|uniref:Helix-turn-helix domain-containing protein n=1 Tax=Pseudomonas cucumis TaxID=2954082 RepID=A0ABY9EP09_9PSED|nr:helix-turn-helix domain-containing protein [Pseudomonas cucumis]WLG82445.1 helix-turn-helix domain-containing protein [Pseudomonas cucumis]